MEKEKNEKILVVLSLVVAIVTLTVGFAAFSNTLTISSSANVKPDQKDFKLVAYGVESWDGVSSSDLDFPEIYTSSTKSVADVSEGISGEDAIISSSVTDSGSNKIKLSNLKASMKNPGDQVMYAFMIKNEGKYDAYLMASELEKYENINEQTVCQAIVEEGKTPPTNAYVDAACKEFTIEVVAYGGEGMSDTLVMGGNVDEYIKIPKAGSNFIDYNFGYSVILVQLTYNGPTRVDGDFTVDFADIELEFTSVPPSN